MQLDRASVQWLEKWLIGKKNVTCLIVSHDSGYVGHRMTAWIGPDNEMASFLDTVTSDINHYENKKVGAAICKLHVWED